MTKHNATARVVGARRQRFELLLTALPGQLLDENRRYSYDQKTHRTYRKSTITPTLLLQANAASKGAR